MLQQLVEAGSYCGGYMLQWLLRRIYAAVDWESPVRFSEKKPSHWSSTGRKDVFVGAPCTQPHHQISMIKIAPLKGMHIFPGVSR